MLKTSPPNIFTRASDMELKFNPFTLKMKWEDNKITYDTSLA